VSLLNHANEPWGTGRMSLSIVIPTFNASRHAERLVSGITQLPSVVHGEVEVVFVDDGSTDGTATQLQALTSRVPFSVRVVCLHRNLGQSQATAIGLSLARHEVIVAMDDDLQHPIEAIPRLVERLISDDLDFVVGGLVQQQQSRFRRLSSSVTHSIARRSLKTPSNHQFSSFMAFRREFVTKADLLNRPRVDVNWMYQITARYGFVTTEHAPSLRGHSNYRLRSLLGVARPFVWYLLGSLVKPLVYVGALTSALSVVLASYYLWLYLSSGEFLPGFATLTMIGLVNLAVVSLFLATAIRLLLIVTSFAQFGSIDRVARSELHN